MTTIISLGSHFPELSPRQREVASMLLSGMSNKEIARQLRISDRTVEDHRGDIYRHIDGNCLGDLASEVFKRLEIQVRP